MFHKYVYLICIDTKSISSGYGIKQLEAYILQQTICKAQALATGPRCRSLPRVGHAMPLPHRPWPRQRCSVLDGWPLWPLCRRGEKRLDSTVFRVTFGRNSWKCNKFKSKQMEQIPCIACFIIAPHSRSCRWAPWVYWPTCAWQCWCTLGWIFNRFFFCLSFFSLASFSSRQHGPWSHNVVMLFILWCWLFKVSCVTMGHKSKYCMFEVRES